MPSTSSSTILTPGIARPAASLARVAEPGWGLECFRQPYRDLIADGAVFDWTGVHCRLAGGDAPAFQSHVEPERAAHAFQHSVDREAAGWWQDGVCVKAYARAPGIHISPNLMSTYPDAVGSIAAQVDDFRARGWNTGGPRRSREAGCLGLPVTPFGSHPHGGVAKRGAPEPRVICAVGWPEVSFPYSMPRGFIGPPALFVSTNSLGGCTKPDPSDPYPPFLRELKSTISDAALNTCVLGHVCMLAGYPIFELAFDFEKWFHQFFYAHGEAWLMGGLVPTRTGPEGALRGELLAILNYVMAMGWRFASGIAQRAANLIVAEALRRFDILEEGFRAEEHPAARRWLEQRFGLAHDCYGRQDRLADMLMFTDDPRIIVAGSIPAIERWRRCRQAHALHARLL